MSRAKMSLLSKSKIGDYHNNNLFANVAVMQNVDAVVVQLSPMQSSRVSYTL